MRGQSHICLGRYLARHYMTDIPDVYIKAFLVGCLEPDRNPLTYLKGSLRCQWLRGHNYPNAHRFMNRISRRLERKRKWNLFDYYTLGKLIHYTTDAFTYAHNANFPAQLRNHMEYEASLQDHFLEYMAQDPQVNPVTAHNIMSAIRRCHRDYEQTAYSISNDSRFALTACCCVLAMLFARPIIRL